MGNFKTYFSKICKKSDIFYIKMGVGHLLRHEGLLDQIWYTKTCSFLHADYYQIFVFNKKCFIPVKYIYFI